MYSSTLLTCTYFKYSSTFKSKVLVHVLEYLELVLVPNTARCVPLSAPVGVLLVEIDFHVRRNRCALFYISERATRVPAFWLSLLVCAILRLSLSHFAFLTLRLSLSLSLCVPLSVSRLGLRICLRLSFRLSSSSCERRFHS